MGVRGAKNPQLNSPVRNFLGMLWGCSGWTYLFILSDMNIPCARFLCALMAVVMQCLRCSKCCVVLVLKFRDNQRSHCATVCFRFQCYTALTFTFQTLPSPLADPGGGGAKDHVPQMLRDSFVLPSPQKKLQRKSRQVPDKEEIEGKQRDFDTFMI